MTQKLQSVSETHEFGMRLAQSLKGGDVVALYGELGSGKTTLAQGIALGLGAGATVTSPTFTLMQLYPIKHNGANNLAHVDTYRIRTPEELLNIGIHEITNDPHTITIIEWPEIMEHWLPHHTKRFHLQQKNSTLTIEYDTPNI